jgi:hypothetical protein
VKSCHEFPAVVFCLLAAAFVAGVGVTVALLCFVVGVLLLVLC